jgi:tRNA uridine 5-carboxymethylaminomethyl modification enzyme
VDDARWDAFARKRDAIAHESERLRSTYVSAGLHEKASLYELLRRPEQTYARLVEAPVVDPAVAAQVEIQAKYEGYIERQREEVARRRDQEELRLPVQLDYATVRGLSSEVQQKLNRHRPETIGQAARISGVTPAALVALLQHVRRRAA